MHAPVAVILLSGFIVASCGSSSEDASRIIAGTRHCGGVAISEGRMIRLSQVSDAPLSSDLYVLQTCIIGGGCSPLATYRSGAPPLVETSPEGVDVTIMGQDLEIQDDEVRLARGDAPTPIRVRAIDSSSTAEVEAFRQSIGLPGVNQPYRMICDTPEPGPSFVVETGQNGNSGA